MANNIYSINDYREPDFDQEQEAIEMELAQLRIFLSKSPSQRRNILGQGNQSLKSNIENTVKSLADIYYSLP